MTPTTNDAAGEAQVERWIDIENRDALLAGLDAVFYDSSATTMFASDEVRHAFRERWLGRYLTHYAGWTFVARARDGSVVGYIVGSHDDPAQTPLFSDIGYFQDFAALTAQYPVQLHVNVSPDWRGYGIGARLLQTFVADVAQEGLPGVHVVTTRGMRNVSYYIANGFDEVGHTLWNGRELVMLGRKV